MKIYRLLILASVLVLLQSDSFGAARKPSVEPSVEKSVAGPPLTLVENGEPRAEIIVAPERPRMTTLAALELSHYVHKMSGAWLPILTEPTPEMPVKIYVGQSPETEKLGVTAEGLKYGAYRIASGPDWLVLLGKDFDFQHPEPWPAKRGEMEKATAAWEEKTKGKTVGWGFPFRSAFKALWNRGDFPEILSSRYGEGGAIWEKSHPGFPGFWEHDEGGTLNAVYGFLRQLGARWFMPGELGEVVPGMTTITVAPVNETKTPAFAVRNWNYYNYSGFSFDDVLYSRQLGMSTGFEKIGLLYGPHGLVNVTSHDAMKAKHPEYYALIGGERDTEHRGYGTPNFQSDGLVQETVNYVRYMFDEYDLPLVDLWPVDGLRLSQDEASKGKGASEQVWGFVDRVAREVYKTHPDKFISCGAYTTYSEAPDSIEKFSPNVVVQISNAGRPLFEDPERWAAYEERIQKWKDKVAPGNIMRLENNRYFIWGGGEGQSIRFPVIHPKAVAKDLKFLKGLSFGDSGEQSQSRMKWSSPGLNHINLYIQSRFLWDPDQDPEVVLDDYFQKFYGPAAATMKEAFSYAEDNIAYKDRSRSGGRTNPANASLEASIHFRDLLETARQQVGDDVYGQRIDLLIGELVPKETLVSEVSEAEKALEESRANAPIAKGVEGSDLSSATPYSLKPSERDQAAGPATTFRVGWDQDDLLLEIVCSEPEMNKVVASPSVHGGDFVSVLLETPAHRYYYIEVNPDGVVVDGNPGPNWKSLADVKTERGSDFWRVLVRIPTVDLEEANSDPHHRVSGSKPTSEAPWYFNVGRTRVTGSSKPMLEAFSPTLRDTMHYPEKFGRLSVD